MNIETGEVMRRQPIFTSSDWLANGDVSGLERIGDELWISDTFNGVIVSYPLEGTSLGEQKFRGLGGPGIVDMVSADDSIWSYDWLTPRILYRCDSKGKLLQWYSIPLDFGETDGPHCQGLAFDGKNLWALDNGNLRISIIKQNVKI